MMASPAPWLTRVGAVLRRWMGLRLVGEIKAQEAAQEQCVRELERQAEDLMERTGKHRRREILAGEAQSALDDLEEQLRKFRGDVE